MTNKPITLDITIFRYFVRKNWPAIQITNDWLDSLKSEFEQYLTAKDLKPDAQALILPRSPGEIMMCQKPNYTHGFHPAFVLHFTHFIKEQLEKKENDKCHFV
jgi:hypothetical protein